MANSMDVPTTVFHKSLGDEPFEASFRLGETIVILNGEISTEIDISDVFDIRVGTTPKAASSVLSGTVLTIGFDGSEGREVLFVDADDSTLDNVAGLLYRRLLHDLEVVVSHPTKIGGRVTDKSFEIGKLLVTPGRVGCAGIDRAFSVELERIVDFSRSTETLFDERRSVIRIQYVKQGVAVSLKLSLTSNRDQHLLGRFLRREYDAVKDQLGRIDLPEPAFHALVRLYSSRGAATPRSLLGNTPFSTEAVVRGLVKANLVEVSDGRVALTSRGWILVTEGVGRDGY